VRTPGPEIRRDLTTFGRERSVMNVERLLRLIAGAFVVVSVLLGLYVHPAFLWFTVFVGANLFQSAFTNWCPMMTLLRRVGARP
jgi:hypothetical protein